MPTLQPTTIEEDWPQYLEFETRFLRFTKYVPLIWQHEGTRSYYLVDLAQNVCSLIETTFKRMANAIGKPLKEDPNIDDCRNLLEPHYKLSSQKIRVKIDEALRKRLRAELSKEDLAHFSSNSQIPTIDGVRPFEAWEKDENPDWWRIYSAKKHNRVEMFDEMTLAQCMMAVSALFLLNVYPVECREFLAKEGVIYTTHGGGGGAFWDTILSGPQVLDSEHMQYVGDFFAETRGFKFEFRRYQFHGQLELRPTELFRGVE